MLSEQENATLTRVGPATPMGILMRRYWVPALLSWELPEPDCPPLEVRLLGEDLVAFRQTDGQIGMVSGFCAHRRASLFWGRNEECGLRCVYHGWKFDITGQCVDMPSEPEESNFKDKVRIPAYPTVEAGGVIWTYMGPPDKQPPPPLFEWTQVPDSHRGLSKVIEECNWLQALEGGIDTVHTNFLHSAKRPAGLPSTLAFDANSARGRAVQRSKAAQVEVQETDYGYSYAGIRSMGDDGYYVRAYHWIMPWNQLRGYRVDKEIPTVEGHMWVPIDDNETMVYNWTYTYGEQPLHDEERRLAGYGNEFDVDIDRTTFRSLRNRGNLYLIDREVQRTQTYSGIQGVNTQDRAVQESMGPVVDRSLERLGTTDKAIIAARRQLLDAVKTAAAGNDPPGLAPGYYKLRALDAVLPRVDNWFSDMTPLLYQTEEPVAIEVPK
jgi:phenylpropionate dioxygenase-like ring-hydroxylating dioxygenase large terminal subunit